MPERLNHDHLQDTVSQKALERPGRKGLMLLEKALRGWEDQALLAAVDTKIMIQAGLASPDVFDGAIKK